MKNVAATKGHKVRRTDFFLLGDTANSDLAWVGAVAVANFYGCLLKRLTLTTASPLVSMTKTLLLAAPGFVRFPGHFGEVSSHL